MVLVISYLKNATGAPRVADRNIQHGDIAYERILAKFVVMTHYAA